MGQLALRQVVSNDSFPALTHILLPRTHLFGNIAYIVNAQCYVFKNHYRAWIGEDVDRSPALFLCVFTREMLNYSPI